MNIKSQNLKPLSTSTLGKLGNTKEAKELLQTLLNQFSHRISDTDISSRNANYLEKAGLMPPHNPSLEGTKWRSFNAIDMLYINALMSMKYFGVRNENLHGLRRLFYNNENVEQIIIALCIDIEVKLIFYPSGECYLFDEENLAVHRKERKDKKQAYILLSLTEILSDGIELEPVMYINDDYIRRMVQNALSHFAFSQLSPSKQESQILSMLQGKDFDSIQIFKKGGKLDRVIVVSDKEFSYEKLKDVIKSKQFGSIVINQANGGVVQFKNEESIKLN